MIQSHIVLQLLAFVQREKQRAFPRRAEKYQ